MISLRFGSKIGEKTKRSIWLELKSTKKYAVACLQQNLDRSPKYCPVECSESLILASLRSIFLGVG